MTNTEIGTRGDGLKVDLAIDTIRYLARSLLGAELDRRDDPLGRPRRLCGRASTRDALTAFLILMHRHGFGVSVTDDAARGDVAISIDPWACSERATPELRLDLAAALSGQHAVSEAESATRACDREIGQISGGGSGGAYCAHVLCDVPRRREDAAHGGYVFGLGQTMAYLEYLTSGSAISR